jgi:uncharacterized protein (DUF697 family)
MPGSDTTNTKGNVMSVYEMEAESQGFLGETGEMESQGFLGETGEMESQGFLGESGEMESQGFLGGLLGSVLGGEVGEMHEAGALHESQEMELASELLEVNGEEELEQFLGNLFSRVAQGVGGFIKSGTGRALGGMLKNLAKKALPAVGGALGSMVVPGLGTAIGSKLGSMAGGLFELELEGMNEQEAEFEVARHFVRLASTAARNAAMASPTAPPRAVARAAVITAARRHAPGLLRGTPYQPRRYGVRRPAGGFRTRRPAGAYHQNGYRGRGTPRPGWGGAPAGGYGYGTPGYGYGTPGDGSDARSYGDGGYGDDQGLPIPSAGRWVRRGRKIVLLGL